MLSLTSQLRKELRLLRPAWVAAAICVCLPITRQVNADGWQMFVAFIGLGLLSVQAFGAEFSQGTFTLYLSQPTQRNRLWLVKFAALAVAMLSLVGLWHGLAAAVLAQNVKLPFAADRQPGQWPLLWLIVLSATGGGLFFSVLLRQATAALWATIIAPPILGGAGVMLISWWSPEGARQITNLLTQPC